MAEKKAKPIWREILEYVIVILLVIIVKVFFVSPIRVNGTSMVPTLEEKDYMLLDKTTYKFKKIKRFDIVVVRYRDSYSKTDELLIKRVIGLPGEKVEYRNNKLYINGNYVKENYTRRDMENFTSEQLGNIKVPDGYYIVMGDNRPVSKDSRMIGFIPRDKIIGKSSFTLFPISRFGSKT